jgi:hypothetical protein
MMDRFPLTSIGSAVGALLIAAVLLAGCEEPPSPATHPDRFSQLIRAVAVDARTQDDSTRLYLVNDENDRIRRAMLDLRIDFVRYDRGKGLVCMWRGGGMSRARGYAHPLAKTPPPVDSVGDLCYRTGPCTETTIDSLWTAWECP